MSYAALRKSWNKSYENLDALLIGRDRKLDVIPSGIMELDRALVKGGIIKGLITELFGPPETGKTTLSGHFASSCQMVHHQDVLVLDYERTLDQDYWASMGVEVRRPWEIDPEQEFDPLHPERYKPGLIVLEPNSIEEGMVRAVETIMAGNIGLWIVDTIAGMTPSMELNDSKRKLGTKEQSILSDQVADNAGSAVVAELTKTSIGGLSREVAQSLKHLTKFVMEKRVAVLGVNQVRNKIGYITTLTTPGGYALHHFANTRIEMKRRKLLEGATVAIPTGTSLDFAGGAGTSKVTHAGAEVEACIVKNKRGIPFAKASMTLTFGSGFDKVRGMYEELVNGGLADREAAVYIFTRGDYEIRFTDYPTLKAQLKTEVALQMLRKNIMAALEESSPMRVGDIAETQPVDTRRRKVQKVKPLASDQAAS